MTRATSSGEATWNRSVLSSTAGRQLGDPAGIGDRGMEHVCGHTATGKFERCGHREILLGCFCRSVRHLSGEPVRPAGR